MKINQIKRVTITYFETPADVDTNTRNITIPAQFDITSENLKDFMELCLEMEVAEILEFRVTETI